MTLDEFFEKQKELRKEPVYLFHFLEESHPFLEFYAVPEIFREDIFKMLPNDQRPDWRYIALLEISKNAEISVPIQILFENHFYKSNKMRLFHGEKIRSINKNLLFRWFVIGFDGSGSSMHVDPNTTQGDPSSSEKEFWAWNALLKGQKRWILIPELTDEMIERTKHQTGKKTHLALSNALKILRFLTFLRFWQWENCSRIERMLHRHWLFPSELVNFSTRRILNCWRRKYQCWKSSKGQVRALKFFGINQFYKRLWQIVVEPPSDIFCQTHTKNKSVKILAWYESSKDLTCLQPQF